MEANKPLRQSKRKRDFPTSSVAGGVERSKRSKRQQGELPVQESSPDWNGLRQEQPADTGDSSVAPEFVDVGDNARDLQQREQEGKGTSSDSDSESEDVKDRVSTFPDLIQEKIFGFLNIHDKIQAAQVCSNWCHAAYKPCLWRHQKVSIDLDRVTKEELLSLSEREISQIKVRGRNKSKMKFLLETFPSLVSLHLESKVQTDIFLQKLSKCDFSSLKDLSVVIESYPKHVPSCLPQSLSRLSSLRTISIRGRVTSQLVQAIGRELHELEELTLLMESGSIRSIDISIRELNSLRCLQSLHLESVPLLDLSDFCQQNARLKKLSLHHSWPPTADWPADLAKATSLEELKLIECYPTEGGLEPLQNLVNLKKLHLWPASDGHWLSVAKISSMEDLCIKLTDEMTNDTIRALGSSLTHLKALKLCGVGTVPPEVFVYFARLPSLQSLHIEHFETDDFVKTLSEGPCSLRSLVISHVTMTSPFELKHLAQICSLREVHLECTKVSCSGLSSLQQESFRLETFELMDCGVTVESVMPLLQTQISLRKLVLVGKEVKKEDFPSPHAVLPNLEVCVLKKSLERSHAN